MALTTRGPNPANFLEEVLRVLREKFQWPREPLQEATPIQVMDVVKEDPADNRILECAAEAKSDYVSPAIRIFCASGDSAISRL